jgi:AcrR family transcriptional regulator
VSRVADPKAKIALLRAAEAVFAERGVSGAKVEDIARQAGLSKGAFYLHFESKEAALKQVVETWLARCASLFVGPADYPETPEDADAHLDFCIERDVQLYEFLWQSRATIRILDTCRGDYVYLLETFRADLRQCSRAWIERWQRDGLYRQEVDLDLAVTLIGGAYEELTLRIVQSERRPPFELWLAFAQDTFVRAFGSPELIDALNRRHQREPSGIPGRLGPHFVTEPPQARASGTRDRRR